MKLSVIVATRNRGSSLSRFLKRLSNVHHPENWEIIVVNNGSTDDTTTHLEHYTSLLPLKVVMVAQPGKSRALNQGMKMATGELILFADDDISIPDDWLIKWAEIPSRYPRFDIFGGRVLLDSSGVPEWILNSSNLQEILVTKHDYGDKDMQYPFGRFPAGPNMAVLHKPIKDKDAVWLEDMGPGTGIPLGDEMGFLLQVIDRESGNCFYVAENAVMHHPEVTRLTYFGCWQRCYWGGFAEGRLRRKYPPITQGKEPFGMVLNKRLRECRSIPEFVAMTARACGVVIGRIVS